MQRMSLFLAPPNVHVTDELSRSWLSTQEIRMQMQMFAGLAGAAANYLDARGRKKSSAVGNVLFTAVCLTMPLARMLMSQ